MTRGTRVASSDSPCWDIPKSNADLRSCSPSVVTASVSSALGKRLVANAMTTKKASAKRPPRIGEDDILPEYDFRRGRRNPYAARLTGGHIVILEPDVAAVF